MNILINCSGIGTGGGVQVADSICRELYKYKSHNFIVVISDSLTKCGEDIKKYDNVVLIKYNFPKSLYSIITGRNQTLDKITEDYSVDSVFTIFGPSIWKPRFPHLCGFARAHILMSESPYFTRMNILDKIKNKILNLVLKLDFKRSANFFWTENPMITSRLSNLFKGSIVYTVSNNYNQVFDNNSLWKEKKLPEFDGITLLTITAPYPHKNLAISIDIAKILKRKRKDFKFRFVMTISSSDIPHFDDYLMDHFLFIGKVDIAECPSLYTQADIMFQPTLLECFTATYPEAMKMKVPIVTTNLAFATGLCGDAAEYYESTSAMEAAMAIYRVSTDSKLREKLINNGQNRLNHFLSYTERANCLIQILENIVNNN